jgi:hypothetical protein
LYQYLLFCLSENSKEIDPEQERLVVPQDKSKSGDIGDAEECPAPAVTEGATLSKSQMKKQLKKQKWEQVKSAKRYYKCIIYLPTLSYLLSYH